MNGSRTLVGEFRIYLEPCAKASGGYYGGGGSRFGWLNSYWYWRVTRAEAFVYPTAKYAASVAADIRAAGYLCRVEPAVIEIIDHETGNRTWALKGDTK